MRARITVEVEISSDDLAGVCTQVGWNLRDPGHPVRPHTARIVGAEILPRRLWEGGDEAFAESLNPTRGDNPQGADRAHPFTCDACFPGLTDESRLGAPPPSARVCGGAWGKMPIEARREIWTLYDALLGRFSPTKDRL